MQPSKYRWLEPVSEPCRFEQVQLSLLREIQSAAVSSGAPVSELLRRCKILAARLGSAEFAKWADQELNGYPDKDSLPEYRVLRHVESKGHFVGPYGKQVKNAPIPPTCLPDDWQDWARTEYLNSGVGGYEELLRKQDDGMFQSPWPADLLRLVGQDIYEYMNCVQAWKVIPRGSIIGLTDAIRNRVLGFALEIERANPSAGEASLNSNPVPLSTVSQVFHTQIYGNVANLASGNRDVRQSGEVNVSRGDLAQLDGALRELRVSAEDITALHEALTEDRREQNKGIGSRAAAWMGTMLSKAASGAWETSLSAASAVLPKLISQHLGLPSE